MVGLTGLGGFVFFLSLFFLNFFLEIYFLNVPLRFYFSLGSFPSEVGPDRYM
jgi:hypothetical protein